MILKIKSHPFTRTKLLGFLHMCLLQPQHGREGDLEGGGDGRPLRENPEAARSRPWMPKLQEGARIQGGAVAIARERLENIVQVYCCGQPTVAGFRAALEKVNIALQWIDGGKFTSL